MFVKNHPACVMVRYWCQDVEVENIRYIMRGLYGKASSANIESFAIPISPRIPGCLATRPGVDMFSSSDGDMPRGMEPGREYKESSVKPWVKPKNQFCFDAATEITAVEANAKSADNSGGIRGTLTWSAFAAVGEAPFQRGGSRGPRSTSPSAQPARHRRPPSPHRW